MAKDKVPCEAIAQTRRIHLSPIDQLPDELRLHEVVPPCRMPARQDNPIVKQCRDCCLEATVVAAIRTVIVPPMHELAFGARKALGSLVEKELSRFVPHPLIILDSGRTAQTVTDCSYGAVKSNKAKVESNEWRRMRRRPSSPFDLFLSTCYSVNRRLGRWR